jgi:hypothetical protein
MVLNIFETSKSRTSCGDVQPRNDRNGIEMGKNSAYITGYEKSNMGEIQQNLGSVFKFHPDPYPENNNCSIVLIMLLWQDLGFLPIRYRHPKWIIPLKASDEIGTLT